MAIYAATGTILIILGLTLVALAIGIWLGAMKVHHINKIRKVDILHIITFYVSGFLLLICANYLEHEPVRILTHPWYLILPAVGMFFGFKTAVMA